MAEKEHTNDTGGPLQDAPPCDERFEAIIHSVSDGVFAVDEEWRITCFNKAAERTTGVKRGEALGRRCSDVFRSDICREACALRYTMETGQPIVNLLVHILNNDGERVPVTVSTALLKDKHGHIIGGVETFRDLEMAKRLLLKVEAGQTQGQIITQDPKLLHILEIVPTIAQSVSTVLIEGESGTGKGLLAQTIHRESGRAGRLVTVNCGALPEQLLESELFGYKTGAFTGATRDKPGRVTVAEGGTLFLDEIGDLPQSVQVKVLRLLQERVYEPLGDVRTVNADVRIVAATNRDLTRLVEDGVIRKDLYYRVNVIRLEMPPLRERMGDVPLLTEALLRWLSTTRGKVVDRLSREARWRLMQYDFPGNVRELENLLEHAYVLCAGSRIEVDDLPEEFLDKVPNGRSNPRSNLSDLEARLIRDVLERKGWNRGEAARELGIHKTTLYRRIRRLGIQLPKVDGRSSKNQKSSRSR
jgi:PAS domain S-box-containing protein